MHPYIHRTTGRRIRNYLFTYIHWPVIASVRSETKDTDASCAVVCTYVCMYVCMYVCVHVQDEQMHDCFFFFFPVANAAWMSADMVNQDK